jgi:drug/metabolite transporter (DMT)-like permease
MPLLRPAQGLDPTWIVFWEHAIAVLILLPWAYFSHRKFLLRLNRSEWISAVIVGVGGSAAATTLFTSAFQTLNPSVVILLQKVQPVVVVLLAFLLLGERPARSFYFWGSIAIAACGVLSFEHWDAVGVKGHELHAKGVLSAVGAALIWAASTVAGKVLLNRTPLAVATFWRFAFGLFGLGLALAGRQLHSAAPVPWETMAQPEMARALLYLALVPGVLAMVAYYAGLGRAPASVVTIVELIFPVTAVLINWAFLGAPLETFQWIAGTVLVLSVSRIPPPTKTPMFFAFRTSLSRIRIREKG